MSAHTIHLIGGSDDEVATLTTMRADNVCRIKFTYRGRELVEDATDYFKAFCQIRVLLEKEKLIPYCYVASLDVYPSGMARDMGQGLKAYKFTIGKHAKIKDLVGVFEDGPDVIPATVANQKAHFEEWLKSPRG